MSTERIYRDDRFPGVEIRNSGGGIFNVWVEGEAPGYYSENGWSNTDCFTSYGSEPDGYGNTAAEAEEKAAAHFDGWAEEEE